MIQYTDLTSAYKELCSIQDSPPGATNSPTIFLFKFFFFSEFLLYNFIEICSSKVRLPLFLLERVSVAEHQKKKNPSWLPSPAPESLVLQVTTQVRLYDCSHRPHKYLPDSEVCSPRPRVCSWSLLGSQVVSEEASVPRDICLSLLFSSPRRP